MSCFNLLSDEFVQVLMEEIDFLKMIAKPIRVHLKVNDDQRHDDYNYFAGISNLTYEQQVVTIFLEQLRGRRSRDHDGLPMYLLSDEVLEQIASQENLTAERLLDIIGDEELAEEILTRLEYARKYTIGWIVDLRYKYDGHTSVGVLLKRLDSKKIEWYDTTYNLPEKGQVVAVRLNENWFNQHIVLEKIP